MTAGPADPRATDERLLDEALIVVREARERAPLDFLVAISLLLGTVAAILMAGGALLGDPARDLCWNLGSEAVGALVTVVLIDGLWKRLETGTGARLRAVETRVRDRRASRRTMTDAERADWSSFVAGFRDLTGQASLAGRLRAARSFGRRAHELELDAERLLRDHPHV